MCVVSQSPSERAAGHPTTRQLAGGRGRPRGGARRTWCRPPTPLSPAGTHIGDAGVTMGIRTGETARSGPPCTLTPSPGGVTCPPCLSFPSLTVRPPSGPRWGALRRVTASDRVGACRGHGPHSRPLPGLTCPAQCPSSFLLGRDTRRPRSYVRAECHRVPYGPDGKWTAAELGGGGRSRGCARLFLFSVCASVMFISAQDPL